MKRATLIHPRKVTKVMTAFLAKVFEVENFTRTFEYISAEDFDKWISGNITDISVTQKDVLVTPVLKARPGFMSFGVCVSSFFDDDDATTIKFLYDPKLLGEKHSNGLDFVMADMGHRASYMKGFSQVSRALLHEVGHVMTHEKVNEQYGEDELFSMRMENRIKNKGNMGYVKLPDEYAATQWAIDWLADKEHRKIVRDFEKQFWACFKK